MFMLVFVRLATWPTPVGELNIGEELKFVIICSVMCVTAS